MAAANAFVARSRYRRPQTLRATQGRSAPLRYGASPGARSRSTGCLRKPGAAAGETAVLFRNNESALPLVDLCGAAGCALPL